MKRVTEAQPVQLGFGERVVIEEGFLRGVVKAYEIVVVPTRGGGYCEAKLSQDTGVEEVKGVEIWNRPGYRITEAVEVTRHVSGDWAKWPIHEGSIIGVRLQQIKEKKKEEKITIEKDPRLS